MRGHRGQRTILRLRGLAQRLSRNLSPPLLPQQQLRIRCRLLLSNGHCCVTNPVHHTNRCQVCLSHGHCRLSSDRSERLLC